MNSELINEIAVWNSSFCIASTNDINDTTKSREAHRIVKAFKKDKVVFIVRIQCRRHPLFVNRFGGGKGTKKEKKSFHLYATWNAYQF